MAMIATAAGAKPGQGFFERHRLPIGLQLYTLGDAVKTDLDGTMARVAAIGYREIELPNFAGHSPQELRKAADRAGLSITSVHLPFVTVALPNMVTMTSEPARIADALGILGARTAVAPLVLLPPDFRPTSGESFSVSIDRSIKAGGVDIWKRAAALLNERASALKPLGIGVGYHNHNLEFAPVGGTTGWEILQRETDPALVTFEVDIGWVAAAGIEPVGFLERIKGRARHLHVKDVAAGTKPNYAFEMSPTETGAGVLPWSRILPAAYAAGVRHFYVEQEPPFTIPREEAAHRSFIYLAGLRA
ncbi:MAG: sugar phosphate isomerase/epimerase [Novosphingobium sp.]|nr:sugar phosphate isomerase/epimerase [Novosphingobium sp.]